MLKRKIAKYIEDHITSDSDKILVIEGARQIGKSYIIRTVGKAHYKNFIEINFVKDDEGPQLFKNIHTLEEFYFILSSVHGKKLGDFSDTLIFLDEIQQYPQYLTLLKFLREDHRFRYIASGSLLGITLRSSISIPIGSIIRKEMYQLDFEEFLDANGVGKTAISAIREKFENGKGVSEELHNYLMALFKRYLLVGGMPDAVNEYLDSHNILKVREVQDAIRLLYGDDASKYEADSGKSLAIRRIYDMIPSQMENKKKRIVAKDIRDKVGDRFDNYHEEFEYLISSGTALNVNAITNPRYPLVESVRKNLLKLYLNDVGLLTARLYGNNIKPVLDDQRSINLGSVYESVVAQELKAHGHRLFYYDNRQKGEVDFLIDNNAQISVMPVEVKSGKDYSVHSALTRLLDNPEYNICSGVVLSNEREVSTKGKVTYMPVYYVMFLDNHELSEDEIYF
ncbi:MAG: ATP-binding protein [Muribaculaceae bacterium]|nr:ATP-binding protein [Muribaculaceae bacterium]